MPVWSICLSCGCGGPALFAGPCCHSGCPDPASGLPRFGASPKLDGPVTLGGQVGGGCCGTPQVGQQCENALPGCGPWVHVCVGANVAFAVPLVRCNVLVIQTISVQFTRFHKMKVGTSGSH